MPRSIAIRMQHYQFTAQALRGVLFREPAGTFALLTGDRCDAFLADLWARTGAEFKRSDDPELPPPTATSVGPCSGFEAVVVRMPMPEHLTEAHLLALLFQLAPGSPAQAPQVSSVRYFALERAAGEQWPTETCLCEWTRNGIHRNHGAGPAPDIAGFLEAVAGALADPR